MLFSDDVRPNTYVTKTQADAICKMAVDAAADPDGVVSQSLLGKAADTDGAVCQSICDYVADKFNLGGYKIAYGYTQFSSGMAILDFSSAGFTSPPIVVFSPYAYSSATVSHKAPWTSGVSITGATVLTYSDTYYDGVYWMAIGN